MFLKLISWLESLTAIIFFFSFLSIPFSYGVGFQGCILDLFLLSSVKFNINLKIFFDFHFIYLFFFNFSIFFLCIMFFCGV